MKGMSSGKYRISIDSSDINYSAHKDEEYVVTSGIGKKS